MSDAAATATPVVKIFTTVALKGVLDELAPDFKRETGYGLAMTFGPGGVVLEGVRAGNVHDVLVSAPATLETLVAEKYAVAGSVVKVARSIIGVAVRAGAPKPKVDTVADFKQALLAAKSVAYTNPATGAASGVHLAKLLEQMGITKEINAKAKLGSGGPVAEFLARGEADLAVQQICEHMLVKGVDVVGPVPPEFQSVTALGAALHSRAPAPDAGRALIALLTSPRAQGCMQAHGLEPVA